MKLDSQTTYLQLIAWREFDPDHIARDSLRVHI